MQFQYSKFRSRYNTSNLFLDDYDHKDWFEKEKESDDTTLEQD